MSCTDTSTANITTYSDFDTTIKSDVKTETKIWSDTVDRNITWEIMSRYDKIPQLEFEEICESEYVKYKNAYRPAFVLDSSMIKKKDSSFMIQTSKANLHYTSEYNTNFGN